MNELNEVYHHVLNDNYSKEKGITIKQTIETHLDKLPIGTRVYTKSLWWKLFRYKVSRGSVSRALDQLAKEKKIRKNTSTGGRNSNWIVV